MKRKRNPRRRTFHIRASGSITSTQQWSQSTLVFDTLAKRVTIEIAHPWEVQAIRERLAEIEKGWRTTLRDAGMP